MNYLIAFLNNFSQVFLIENRFLGLAILISLILVKPRIGLFSAFGNALSLAFSLIFNLDETTTQAGILGFNSVLIGIACALFLPKNELTVLVTIIACLAAVLLQTLAMNYFIFRHPLRFD